MASVIIGNSTAFYFNSFFSLTTKKTSKLRINSPLCGESLDDITENSVSMSWRHRENEEPHVDGLGQDCSISSA